MARILYGAPESEQEENNDLVRKLRGRRIISYERDNHRVMYSRERNTVEYLNDFLGFAWELSRCNNSILLPQKYDLVVYDTKLYGEHWLADLRAENFKLTISPLLVRSVAPVLVLADKEIKDDLENWIESYKFHYVAQPYSLDEVVTKVRSLLPKPRQKKQEE
ncbi:MAG: hypothetical protein Q8R47_05185 [Nanoarchaeota archaeon]|nr:hypothetical protein [Nanoarchaeota archaeon]